MTENNEGSKPSETTALPQVAAEITPQTFGAWLQGHRTSRRISLEEIAAVTKVHIMQLKALEENMVAKLPAPAFVRGFLVSYARHLGIDENEVLDRYKTAFGGSLTPIADLLTPSQNKSARSASAPKVTMVSSPHLKHAPGTKEIKNTSASSFSFKSVALATGAIGIVVLVGTLIALGRNQKKPIPGASLPPTAETPAAASAEPTAIQSAPTTGHTTPTAPPSVAAKNAPTSPAPEAAATPSAAPLVTTPPATAPTAAAATAIAAAKEPLPVKKDIPVVRKEHQLELKAIDANYVHLKVDELAPKGHTLAAAQSQIIEVSKKAVLTISDAGNLEIRWDGVWYSSLGYRGDLKVITLPDQLSTLTPKSAPPKAAPKPKAKPVVEIPESEPLE